MINVDVDDIYTQETKNSELKLYNENEIVYKNDQLTDEQNDHPWSKIVGYRYNAYNKEITVRYRFYKDHYYITTYYKGEKMYYDWKDYNEETSNSINSNLKKRICILE